MRRPPGHPLVAAAPCSAQRISALHSTSRTGVDDTTATQCPAGADLPASGPPWTPWSVGGHLLLAVTHTDASAADEPHKRFESELG
jgi:hypothetical protein